MLNIAEPWGALEWIQTIDLADDDWDDSVIIVCQCDDKAFIEAKLNDLMVAEYCWTFMLGGALH